jgi:hypothetical protein
VRFDGEDNPPPQPSGPGEDLVLPRPAKKWAHGYVLSSAACYMLLVGPNFIVFSLRLIFTAFTSASLSYRHHLCEI